jgi:N utilization substance protein B
MTTRAPSKGSGGRGKSQGRPRTGARVAAVQALFQSEQADESAETVIDQFTRHRLGNRFSPASCGLPFKARLRSTR